MSPVSTKPSESSALPPEFSHKALQSLVRRGRTSGSVTGEQVAEALRAADVTAARGRVVLRALGEQGIVVAAEQGANGVAAATTRTTKKTSTSASTASRASASGPAAKTATKTAATKTAATEDRGDEDRADEDRADEVQPGQGGGDQERRRPAAPPTA